MAKKKSNSFRTEIYFVGGKMKKRKIPLIDGMEVEEFIRRNADDAFLVQEGHFDILYEREINLRQPNKALEPTTTSVTHPACAGCAPDAVAAHL
jgi:hypothetical protein